MSRAERRRLERENLRVISEKKKKEDFANTLIKEFTPSQIIKIHKYAEILKDVEIKKGIELVEKFGNVVMCNAVQGALAQHTELNTEEYGKILATIREFGIEDAAAITAKTKKEGKEGLITIDQGMEEFYMAIEKKHVEMIERAKELLKQKFNQKKIIESLKKEFSVPTGAANLAFRKAKEQRVGETLKEVAQEVAKEIIKPVEPVKEESTKQQVIKYLNAEVNNIENKTNKEILKTIEKKFHVADSTAKAYYYAWKKEYMGSEKCEPVYFATTEYIGSEKCEPVYFATTEKKVVEPVETEKIKIDTNINRIEEKKEVNKMNELSIVDQLKHQLEVACEDEHLFENRIKEMQDKLEETKKRAIALKTAINALEGVNL